LPSTNDIIFGLTLSYCWTGYGMVSFHSQQFPLYQPGYVSAPLYRRFICGAIWPVIAKLNKEFAWFFVSFLSEAIFFSFLHALAHPYIGSIGLTIAIALLRFIPGISFVFNAPFTWFAVILWHVLAKPFGARVPSSIERMQKERRIERLQKWFL